MDPIAIADAVSAVTESLSSQRAGIDSVMLSLDQALTETLGLNADTVKLISNSVKSQIAKDTRRNDLLLGPVLNDVTMTMQSSLEEQGIALQNAAAFAVSGVPQSIDIVPMIPVSATVDTAGPASLCTGPGMAVYKWRDDNAWEPVSINPCPSGWVRQYPSRNGTYVGEILCVGCVQETSGGVPTEATSVTPTSGIEETSTNQEVTPPGSAENTTAVPSLSGLGIVVEPPLYELIAVPSLSPIVGSPETPPLPSPIERSPPIMPSEPPIPDVPPREGSCCCASDWFLEPMAFWGDTMTQTERDHAFARVGLGHWIGAKSVIECVRRSIVGSSVDFGPQQSAGSPVQSEPITSSGQ